VIAIPLGWLAGWLMGRLVFHWREQNQFVGLSLTILLAYGTFMLAEIYIDTSGVIAVLCASLAFNKTRWGKANIGLTSNSELFHTFWAYLNTLAGSVLFFTLGVAVGTHAFFWGWVLPGVVFLMLIARFVVVYSGAIFKRRRERFPMGWRHVLMLGGVRGALSAALVQIIPHDYPYRIVFLCLAFVVIMFSLIILPLILKSYLRNYPVQ
jgi:CPA1 family monovalent cation:H+ antiporter